MRLVERKIYLEKLENLRDTPDIKVITGMRRSGKSVIVQQFINRIKQTEPLAHVLFVDFTRLEFEELKDYRRLSSWAEENRREGVRNYLVIDEVQMCEKFEHAINSLHASQNFDIYLTGSNAFLLSSDLATLFTGRAMVIEVFPFSFAEYRLYFGYEQRVDEAFDDYVRKGGLPGSYVYRTETERTENLLETYKTIVQRDLIEKYRLGNAAAMHCIGEFLMDNIGNITSPNNVSKSLAVKQVEPSHVTTGNYIRHLCHAFIFAECKRYDLKGAKYLESLSKYYLYDHGLRFAVLGNRYVDYGRLYENIVYIELRRRGYEVYVGKLYEKEVDFVASRGSERFYIQVSDDISNEKTLARELAPLEKIADAYPKILIARTHHDESILSGIRIIDIARWLAGEETQMSVASRIRSRVKTALAQDFKSVADVNGRGQAEFDFLANSGLFTVEANGTTFGTSWSEAGSDSVQAYKDRVELLGIKPGIKEFPSSVEELEQFDFTRRSSVCYIGDIVVFMNRDGRFLAVKILGVQVKSRGANRNLLSFSYRVY